MSAYGGCGVCSAQDYDKGCYATSGENGGCARLAQVEKAHAEAIDEWARLEGLLKAFADRVEKLAFDMKPPNVHTPQFVQLVQYVRSEINQSTPQRDHT